MTFEEFQQLGDMVDQLCKMTHRLGPASRAGLVLTRACNELLDARDLYLENFADQDES